MSINERVGFEIVWFIGGVICFVFGILFVYHYFYPAKQGFIVKILRAENKKLKDQIFKLKNDLIEDRNLLRVYKSKLEECENDKRTG